MAKTLIKQDVLASSKAKFLNNVVSTSSCDMWIYFPRLL